MSRYGWILPLIARAIAGLDPSAPGESRRALYERARSALIEQLRSVQPPLSESEITRERAVAGRGRAQGRIRGPPSAPRLARAAPPGGRGRGACGDAFRRANAGGRSGGATFHGPDPALRPGACAAGPSRGERPRSDRKTSALRSATFAPIRRARGARNRSPDAGSAAAADPRTVRRAAPRPRQHCPAGAAGPRVRGFRDIAADADDLGRAPAQASRSARRPMPTCRRPRRSSTGSTQHGKTAAPIPTRHIV